MKGKFDVQKVYKHVKLEIRRIFEVHLLMNIIWVGLGRFRQHKMAKIPKIWIYEEWGYFQCSNTVNTEK